jgi:hypothetical protein
MRCGFLLLIPSAAAAVAAPVTIAHVDGLLHLFNVDLPTGADRPFTPYWNIQVAQQQVALTSNSKTLFALGFNSSKAKVLPNGTSIGGSALFRLSLANDGRPTLLSQTPLPFTSGTLLGDSQYVGAWNDDGTAVACGLDPTLSKRMCVLADASRGSWQRLPTLEALAGRSLSNLLGGPSVLDDKGRWWVGVLFDAEYEGTREAILCIDVANGVLVRIVPNKLHMETLALYSGTIYGVGLSGGSRTVVALDIESGKMKVHAQIQRYWLLNGPITAVGSVGEGGKNATLSAILSTERAVHSTLHTVKHAADPDASHTITTERGSGGGFVGQANRKGRQGEATQFDLVTVSLNGGEIVSHPSDTPPHEWSLSRL